MFFVFLAVALSYRCSSTPKEVRTCVGIALVGAGTLGQLWDKFTESLM